MRPACVKPIFVNKERQLNVDRNDKYGVFLDVVKVVIWGCTGFDGIIEAYVAGRGFSLAS